ncbi:MAG: dihydrodipicolinate synthase family protein [Bacteroidota bacterium]
MRTDQLDTNTADRIDKKVKGVVVPAITPFTKDHQLDEEAVEKLISFFYANDVQPFIQGTTGEAPSLSTTLKNRFIQKAAASKKTGSHLYVGISSACLEESVDMAKCCADNGVDIVVATIPSYYALTETQIKKYFEQLADASPVPLVIYNIPATTHVSLPLEIIDALSYHFNIVGYKDSERSDVRLSNALRLWKQRSDFSHFTGWAARSAQALIDGSDGIIPSTGNLYAGIYRDMFQAVHKKNYEKAYELQELSDKLGDLYQAGKTLGESLAALKYLMQQSGLCKQFVMPPLQELNEEQYSKLISRQNELLETKLAKTYL